MRATTSAIAAALALAAAGQVPAALAQNQAGSHRGAFAALAAAGVVADTMIAGEPGVQIVAPGDTARAWGLRPGDVVLAAGGERPAADWRSVPPAAAGTVTWTVWRRVPGDRPVVTPAILGRKTLDEFTGLAAAERTPMRLARMLANRATLVRDGAGVLLVPEPTAADDAAWLRVANPMPAASESALVVVATALLQRVNIPPAAGGEAAAARADLDAKRFVEAEEHARRAILQMVQDPARRAPGPEFDAALAMYVEAQQSAAREREELLAPEARFGFVAEGGVSYIQAFPAQHTLHEVENSYGSAWAVGVRLGWPGSSPGWLANFSLLAEYGQVRNTFDGPDYGGFASTLQQITGEIVYRPRVASRLRPYFRGGVGAFPLRMRVQVPEGYRVAFERTNVGFVAGGGIDVLRVPAAHLRLAIGGTYRILKYKIAKDNAPAVEETRNTDLTVVTTVDNNPNLLLFDMDGWQAGLMLTFEP